MKQFNHIHHEIPSITRIDDEGKRVYQTPTDHKYPSVTSVTSIINEDSIKKWRNRVGEEQANQISSRACNRGTAIHSLCESYLLNEQTNPSIFDKEVFDSLVPYLDKFDNIHALETQLYSNVLEVAGTVDCIAEYDGKLYIIDFKTSKKPKKKEYINNYFMQCAAYSYMFWERTSILVEELMILVAIDDEEPQVFIEPVKPWLEKFTEVRKEFKEKKGY